MVGDALQATLQFSVPYPEALNASAPNATLTVFVDAVTSGAFDTVRQTSCLRFLAKQTRVASVLCSCSNPVATFCHACLSVCLSVCLSPPFLPALSFCYYLAFPFITPRLMWVHTFYACAVPLMMSHLMCVHLPQACAYALSSTSQHSVCLFRRCIRQQQTRWRKRQRGAQATPSQGRPCLLWRPARCPFWQEAPPLSRLLKSR